MHSKPVLRKKEKPKAACLYSWMGLRYNKLEWVSEKLCARLNSKHSFCGTSTEKRMHSQTHTRGHVAGTFSSCDIPIFAKLNRFEFMHHVAGTK